MSHSEEEKQRLSRRRFLAAASCGMAAAAGLNVKAAPGVDNPPPQTNSPNITEPHSLKAAEPFWGEHQGGILTEVQSHTYFAALDLVATKREEVIEMLRAWTAAASRMTEGQTAQPMGEDPAVPGSDSGEALSVPPARLTMTFGLGAGVFVKDGQDRYGLAARRPAALVDLP